MNRADDFVAGILRSLLALAVAWCVIGGVEHFANWQSLGYWRTTFYLFLGMLIECAIRWRVRGGEQR